MNTPGVNGAGSAPGPSTEPLAGIEVAVDALLANLGALFARQLTEANVEAARWKAVAQASAGELAALRGRIDELEVRLSTANGAPAAHTVTTPGPARTTHSFE